MRHIRPEQLTRPKPVLDYDTFFHTEYQRLFQTMYLLVRDRTQAEDIAQEAMARTYERWRGLRDPAGYAYRTAFNLRRNWLRRLAIAAAKRVEPASARDEVEAAERRVDVLRALAELPRTQREALVLVAWADMTAEEAGRVLGIQPVSVRGRVHRARRRCGSAWEAPMGDVNDLLRTALGGVEPSEDALARTLGRIRRRERRRRIVLASVTVLVFLGASAGLLVRLDAGDVAGPSGQPGSSAATGSSAAPPSTAARRPALFVPEARREGDRKVLPVTFPDGSTAELVYPANLDLAGMGVQPDVSILDSRNPAERSPLVFLHRGTPGLDVLQGAQPVQRPATRTGRPVEIWQARPESAVAPNQAFWVVYKVGAWTVLASASDLTVATDIVRHLDGRETSDGSVVLTASAPLALSHEFGEGGGVQLAIGDRDPRPGQVDVGARFRLVLLSPMGRACRSEGLSSPGESASKCLKATGTGGAVLATISGDRRFVQAVFDGLEIRNIHLVS